MDQGGHTEIAPVMLRTRRGDVIISRDEQNASKGLATLCIGGGMGIGMGVEI